MTLVRPARWVEASNLVKGNKILSAHGSYGQVQQVSFVEQAQIMDDKFLDDRLLLIICSFALTIRHGRSIYHLFWKPDEYNKASLKIDITPKFLNDSRAYLWFVKGFHIFLFLFFLLLFSILILDLLNIT